MGKSSKSFASGESTRFSKDHKSPEEFPSYIYTASAHHSMVMELLKKAQDLEYKIKNVDHQSVEITYKRLEKASEIYQKCDHLIYFGEYYKFFSMKEIDEVYKGIRRTTIFDYEPLCFIRE
jgi:hypothetical protein